MSLEIHHLDDQRLSENGDVSVLIHLSIHLVHDDNKDKEFELEMTWVCAESGGKHKAVPQDLLNEADAKGRAALEEGMEED